LLENCFKAWVPHVRYRSTTRKQHGEDSRQTHCLRQADSFDNRTRYCGIRRTSLGSRREAITSVVLRTSGVRLARQARYPIRKFKTSVCLGYSPRVLTQGPHPGSASHLSECSFTSQADISELRLDNCPAVFSGFHAPDVPILALVSTNRASVSTSPPAG
jgi:hypothetical protein